MTVEEEKEEEKEQEMDVSIVIKGDILKQIIT